jgi:hypothetical protein
MAVPAYTFLGHGVLDEVLGSEHGHPSGVHVLLRRHALDPAEVVDVAVGVHDPGDGPVTAVRAIERETRSGGLDADEGVDDDRAPLPLDERHHRQVQAPDLVDAGYDLEQPVPGQQPGLPPQARVHRRRRLTVEEGVGLHVPHHPAARVTHHRRVESPQEAALRVVEIGGVGEREAGQQVAVLLGDMAAGCAGHGPG